MEPVQSEPLQPSQSSPQSWAISTFLSRKKLLIGTTVVLVLILILLSLFISRSATQEKSQPKKTSAPSVPATLTGLEVAEKIAIFLKKAKRGDGSFYLRYRCSPTIQDICVVQMDEGPSGQITIAFLELYKKTQDLEYKLLADSAIAYQLAACQRIVKECERAMTAFAAYYVDTKEARYRNAMMRVEKHVLSEKELGGNLANNDGGKLELLYKVTGEEKYRNRLVQIADRFLAGEFKGEGAQPFITAYVYLPAYRVTNDSRYLAAAKDLITKANLPANLSEFEQKENSYALVVGLDSLITLSQTDSAFADDAKKVGEFLLRTLWDTPQNKKFNADYGFVHFFGKKEPNAKYTVNNGWLAFLYATMGEERFTLR